MAENIDTGGNRVEQGVDMKPSSLDANFAGLKIDGVTGDSGFSHFKSIFSTLPPDIQGRFTDQTRIEIVKKFVQQKGFPIFKNVESGASQNTEEKNQNEQAYYKSYEEELIDFSVDYRGAINSDVEAKAQQEEVQAQQEEVQGNSLKLEHFNTIASNLLPAIESLPVNLGYKLGEAVKSEGDFFQCVKLIQEYKGDDAKKIEYLDAMVAFLDGAGNLEKVLTALKQVDKKNSDEGKPTKFYDGFASAAKNMSPEFASRIAKFEACHGGTLDSAGYRTKFETEASLPEGDQTKDGTVVRVQNDGLTTEVNMATEPPSRRIKSPTGYTLELPNLGSSQEGGKFDFYKEPGVHEASLKFEKSKCEFDAESKKIQGGFAIVEQYRGMYIGEDSIQDKASIIRILKLNLQTPFDHEFDDIQDNDEKSFETIKQKLEAKRVAIEQKFVEAEKAYETFLADQKILHRASLAKKDENIRKTMDFLHTIGFDLLPQNATNALLAQLNAKTGGNVHLCIPNKIDVTITSFTLDPFEVQGGGVPLRPGIDNPQNKKIFAMLMNKMITGDPSYPIDVDSISMVGTGIQFKENSEGEKSSQQMVDPKFRSPLLASEPSAGPLTLFSLQTYMNRKLGIDNGITGSALSTIRANLKQKPEEKK